MNLLKTFKMSIGFVLACLIAQYFSLNYVASCGIVAILSIQNTKKETFKIVFERLLSFFLATVLISIISYFMDFSYLSFGIFLFIFIIISLQFNISNGISMNAVIATHYLIEQSTSIQWIFNEFFLFTIGSVIGILLNLYMPSNDKKFKLQQQEIEQKFKDILSIMSTCLLKDNKTGSLWESINQLEQQISNNKAFAYTTINNHLLNDTQYQLAYLQMRHHQLDHLKQIYQQMMQMNYIPKQTELIALLLTRIANSFHEYNVAVDLIEQVQQIKKDYKHSPLPQSRIEFENRACLIQILNLIHEFLTIKYEFVMKLSQNDKNKYWIN